MREKGTNRHAFLRGEIDRYSWIDSGSSYVLSDLLAALLRSQLANRATIKSLRKRIWHRYLDALGLPAVLPPPEEEKDVKTAIGAARAKAAREEMI